METKQHLTLEVKKNDFNFIFHMPSGASWGNAIDASFEILQHISQLAKNSAQSIKPSQELVQEEE